MSLRFPRPLVIVLIAMGFAGTLTGFQTNVGMPDVVDPAVSWQGSCYQDKYGTWWQKTTKDTPDAKYIDGGWWVKSTPECELPPITVVPDCPTPGQGREQVTVQNPFSQTARFFIRSEDWQSEEVTLRSGESYTFVVDVSPDYIGGGAELVIGLKETKQPIVVPFDFLPIPPGCEVPKETTPETTPSTISAPTQPAPPKPSRPRAVCVKLTAKGAISIAGPKRIGSQQAYSDVVTVRNPGRYTQLYKLQLRPGRGRLDFLDGYPRSKTRLVVVKAGGKFSFPVRLIPTAVALNKNVTLRVVGQVTALPPPGMKACYQHPLSIRDKWTTKEPPGKEVLAPKFRV